MNIILVNGSKQSLIQLKKVLKDSDFEVDEVSNIKDVLPSLDSDESFLVMDNHNKLALDFLEKQSLVAACIIQKETISKVNTKFLELFGYSNNIIAENLSFHDIIAPSSKEKVQEICDNLFNGTKESQQFEFTAVDGLGREIDVEVWFKRIDLDGQPALQGIISDLSEHKEFHMREKAYQQRMMNEHKLSSIGKLAGGIAHNLNTPISVIITNAELLQLKYENSNELDKILRQADRMSTIINRLLIKSKQEQLKDPQYIEINKLISDELEFLNSNLEFKHNVKKDIQLDDTIPPIFAVYSDISQSIMNILQNAIDAMYKRPEKKLTLITKLKDHTIFVIIKDTGVGIDEKNYLKLFDPFYTTKPTRQDRKDTAPTGTGLGLATVYNLLTPYNIKIDVESTVDVGTTFTLRLPLDQLSKKNKVTV